MTKIIALAGSLKAESLNHKLVTIAAEAAKEAGAEVDLIKLTDFDIPLFSEDLEAQGTPDAVTDLKSRFAEADGFLIGNPEYNGSITGALKNLIDWLSRPGDRQVGSAFQGKVAGLVATSPGGLGGLRGLNHTRDILFNLGTIVLPNPVAVPSAYQAFDEADQLKDPKLAERIAATGRSVAEAAAKLS